ncbi:hypothetical protein O181_097123 [Austropuccinia psidii MF-1]|uniref:Uncharacterized protein n=1 Tax=Austropuccinia psidii MF-1 TaxID=1389203 RepID=A0A9Q3J6V8_9BASI|nr:hypothetical protein [Austropuccinia psidii MF-1]
MLKAQGLKGFKKLRRFIDIRPGELAFIKMKKGKESQTRPPFKTVTPPSAKGSSQSKSPQPPNKEVMMDVLAGIGTSINKIIEAPEQPSASILIQNNSHETLRNAIQASK